MQVLALLLMNPSERWHLRDIARRAQLAVGTVRRELTQLTDAGITKLSREGNRTYYAADKSCPIFDELAGLARKTCGMTDILRTSLAEAADSIDLAFIYGSQANGSATKQSDVDLMVVGGVDEMKLHKAIMDAEEKIARPVNYTLISRREFMRRRREKGGFIARVLATKRIPILGDIDDLR